MAKPSDKKEKKQGEQKKIDSPKAIVEEAMVADANKMAADYAQHSKFSKFKRGEVQP